MYLCMAMQGRKEESENGIEGINFIGNIPLSNDWLG